MNNNKPEKETEPSEFANHEEEVGRPVLHSTAALTLIPRDERTVRSLPAALNKIRLVVLGDVG